MPGHPHDSGDHRRQFDVGSFEHFLDPLDQAIAFLNQACPRAGHISNGLLLDSWE